MAYDPHSHGRRPSDNISPISNYSPATYVAGSTPQSPVRAGSSFQSFAIHPPSTDDFTTHPTIPEAHEDTDLPDHRVGDRPSRALDPDHVASPTTTEGARPGPSPITRVPVGTKPFSPDPSYTSYTSISSPSHEHEHERQYSTSTAYDPPPTTSFGSAGFAPDDHLPNRYQRASESSLHAAPDRYSSTDQLTRNAAPHSHSIRSAQSRRSKYDNEFQPDACPSTKPFYQGRSNWLAVTILILAVFSTVFSGIYMAIALRAPRWGTAIHSRGALTPATANVLVQLFAKLIELSFVTVVVTVLGQILSRRAFSLNSRGITLAELQLRQWIMQPGTLITHYESLRFAGLTLLGAVALTVTVMAMLYTTAASALISPVLRFGDWEPRLLTAPIGTSFANPNYLNRNCKTPIMVSDWDPELSLSKVAQTCLTIDNAAKTFNNYQQYLSTWTNLAVTGNGSEDQAFRPNAFALWQQNTTINGTWVEKKDTRLLSKQFNRVINNVTLVMPHVGVINAARNVKNQILQPDELGGVGVYNIRAAVPAPYINVLCAHATKQELSPIVYETAGTNVTLNVTADLPTRFT
jgi:hypothetical protein